MRLHFLSRALGRADGGDGRAAQAMATKRGRFFDDGEVSLASVSVGHQGIKQIDLSRPTAEELRRGPAPRSNSLACRQLRSLALTECQASPFAVIHPDRAFAGRAPRRMGTLGCLPVR